MFVRRWFAKVWISNVWYWYKHWTVNLYITSELNPCKVYWKINRHKIGWFNIGILHACHVATYGLHENVLWEVSKDSQAIHGKKKGSPPNMFKNSYKLHYKLPLGNHDLHDNVVSLDMNTLKKKRFWEDFNKSETIQQQVVERIIQHWQFNFVMTMMGQMTMDYIATNLLENAIALIVQAILQKVKHCNRAKILWSYWKFTNMRWWARGH